MSQASKHMKAASPYGRHQYYAALDGFRGLLALFVAIHHTTWFSYLNYRSFINEGFFRVFNVQPLSG